MLKHEYLLEDFQMASDNLETLIKVPYQIYESALRGDFVHNQNLIMKMEQSIKILEALHNKKLERDQYTDSAWVNANHGRFY